jgi:hypothetical protein
MFLGLSEGSNDKFNVNVKKINLIVKVDESFPINEIIQENNLEKLVMQNFI